MSADVIDFHTRQKIPEGDVAFLAMAYTATAQEFNHALAVWPDFSQAAKYHAPDKDSA